MKLKPVNLIPRGALKRPWLKRLMAFSWQNRQLSRFIVFGFALILFFIAAPAIIVNSYKFKVSSTKRAIEDTKIKFKKMQSQDFQAEKLKASLTKEETLLRQRADLLSSTMVKNGGYAGLSLVISGILPQDVWLSRFIMNDDEIQISGSTVNSQLIADFMDKLEAAKDFRNTRFVSTEKQVVESHTIYNFQIITEPSWSLKRTLSSAAKKAKE